MQQSPKDRSSRLNYKMDLMVASVLGTVYLFLMHEAGDIKKCIG